MADHYTHFSCLLGVGTADNAAKAMALYETLREQVEDEDGGGVGFLLEAQPEDGGVWLWIYDDVNGDPDHVAAFVQRLAEELKLTGLWGFGWANSCSRPRVGAFGGGAYVIDLATGETSAWVSTNQWLESQLAARGKIDA